MARILPYVVDRRQQKRLGPQVHPEDETLCFRAPCPICGRVNKAEFRRERSALTLTFHCMHHGQYALDAYMPDKAALLACNNARLYILLASMVYLLDTTKHHDRVTGGECAGGY